MKHNDNTYDYRPIVVAVREEEVQKYILTEEDEKTLKELGQKLEQVEKPTKEGLTEKEYSTLVKQYVTFKKAISNDITQIQIHKTKDFMEALARALYHKLQKIGMDGITFYTYKKQDNGVYAVYVGLLPRYASYLDFIIYCKETGHKGWFTAEDTPEKRKYVKWLKEKAYNY